MICSVCYTYKALHGYRWAKKALNSSNMKLTSDLDYPINNGIYVYNISMIEDMAIAMTLCKQHSNSNGKVWKVPNKNMCVILNMVPNNIMYFGAIELGDSPVKGWNKRVKHLMEHYVLK